MAYWSVAFATVIHRAMGEYIGQHGVQRPEITRKRPSKLTAETIGRRLLEIVVYEVLPDRREANPGRLGGDLRGWRLEDARLQGRSCLRGVPGLVDRSGRRADADHGGWRRPNDRLIELRTPPDRRPNLLPRWRHWREKKWRSGPLGAAPCPPGGRRIGKSGSPDDRWAVHRPTSRGRRHPREAGHGEIDLAVVQTLHDGHGPVSPGVGSVSASIRVPTPTEPAHRGSGKPLERLLRAL